MSNACVVNNVCMDKIIKPVKVCSCGRIFWNFLICQKPKKNIGLREDWHKTLVTNIICIRNNRRCGNPLLREYCYFSIELYQGICFNATYHITTIFVLFTINAINKIIKENNLIWPRSLLVSLLLVPHICDLSIRWTRAGSYLLSKCPNHLKWQSLIIIFFYRRLADPCIFPPMCLFLILSSWNPTHLSFSLSIPHISILGCASPPHILSILISSLTNICCMQRGRSNSCLIKMPFHQSSTQQSHNTSLACFYLITLHWSYSPYLTQNSRK